MDFVEGVATALLPVTFFEVVMNKAFRRLVGEDAEVSVDTGLRAAEKLQSFLDRHDQRNEAADMRRQVNLILGAVKSTVPQEMWARSSRRSRSFTRPHLPSTTKPTTTTTFSIRATAMTWMTQCKC